MPAVEFAWIASAGHERSPVASSNAATTTCPVSVFRATATTCPSATATGESTCPSISADHVIVPLSRETAYTVPPRSPTNAFVPSIVTPLREVSPNGVRQSSVRSARETATSVETSGCSSGSAGEGLGRVVEGEPLGRRARSGSAIPPGLRLHRSDRARRGRRGSAPWAAPIGIDSGPRPEPPATRWRPRPRRSRRRPRFRPRRPGRLRARRPTARRPWAPAGSIGRGTEVRGHRPTPRVTGSPWNCDQVGASARPPRPTGARAVRSRPPRRQRHGRRATIGDGASETGGLSSGGGAHASRSHLPRPDAPTRSGQVKIGTSRIMFCTPIGARSRAGPRTPRRASHRSAGAGRSPPAVRSRWSRSVGLGDDLTLANRHRRDP